MLLLVKGGNIMIGQKFGMLTVLADGGMSGVNRYWICQCDCGTTKRIRGNRLRSGENKSCGCMRGLKPQYTKEMVASVAQLCTTKRQFRTTYPSEYNAATRNKWLAELGAHLKGCGNPKTPKPDPVSNAIYIWRAVNQTHNAVPIYKIGVTSAKYNGRRISAVAKTARVEHEIVILMQVQNCRELEKTLLSLGTPVSTGKFNGSTEFRALTDTEISHAVAKIIESR